MEKSFGKEYGNRARSKHVAKLLDVFRWGAAGMFFKGAIKMIHIGKAAFPCDLRYGQIRLTYEKFLCFCHPRIENIFLGGNGLLLFEHAMKITHANMRL